MIPAILVGSLILMLVVVLLVRSRPRVVAVTDGTEDASGQAYSCVICGSRRVEVSDYRERCLTCGYSLSEDYSGRCGTHIDLLRDVDAAITHLEAADFQLGGSDPNWSTYASELTQGIAQISSGAPLLHALLALDEPELAERLRQLMREEGGYATRAERYAQLLRLARDVLSKDIQRQLHTRDESTPRRARESHR